MKFYVIFTVIFVFTTLRTISSYSKFHNNFIVEAFKLRPNRNTVVSSLALQFGLCKLASTIEESGKKEIMTALGYTDDKQLKECYDPVKQYFLSLQRTDLVIVNTLYINYTLEVYQKIINGSKVNFGIDIKKVGFDFHNTAVNYINRQIAAATFSRIRDVITFKDLNIDTSMLFITAAHIKPTWETHMYLKLTKERQFRRADSRISLVPMMNYLGSSLYYENHGCKYFVIYLRSMALSISFVLPPVIKGINGLLTDIQRDPNLFKTARRNMEWKEISLVFPRFKIKNDLNLTSVLNKTGITEILKKNTTCLKKMLKKDNSQPMYISGVKQSIFLDVDEFGVYRTLNDDGGGYPRERDRKMMNFEVVLDKPFYFSINFEILNLANDTKRTSKTERYYELFSGVYNGPE